MDARSPVVAARAAMAVATVLGISACGGARSAPEAVELTPAGFAEVVRDHIDQEPQEVTRWDVMTRELGVEAPGANFQFGGHVSLSVAVTPGTDSSLVCADESFFDECVDFTHNGEDLVLAWQELEPEEDPGVVFVIDRRDGEDVLTDYSGVSITGDPRELDLGITIEQMADIVTDERLTLG